MILFSSKKNFLNYLKYILLKFILIDDYISKIEIFLLRFGYLIKNALKMKFFYVIK